MNNIDYNKDYYKVLGVDKKASESEIKKRFHKLSMEYHPDHQNGKSESEKAEATSKFQEINEAYEVIGDKKNREQYDQMREMGGANGFGRGGMHFGFGGMGDDMMGDFMRRHGFGPAGFGGGGMDDDFGGFSRHAEPKDPSEYSPIDGRNIRINVSLPFEDFYFGCTKTLEIKVENHCKHCHNGINGDKAEFRACPRCHGSGYFSGRQGNMVFRQTCTNCMGTGKILANICSYCNGTTVDGVRTQSCTLDIPKFSYSGFTKTFSGVGNCGRFGGNTGDISIIVSMDDSGRFCLYNDYNVENLHSVHIVPLLKGLIGGTERILTPYGYTEVEIPPMKNEEETITIRGKGLKKQNSNENGDLIVTLHWEVPSSINEKERETIQKALKSMSSRSDVFENTDKLHEIDEDFVKRMKTEFGH